MAIRSDNSSASATRSLRILPRIVPAIVALTIVATACREEHKDFVDGKFDFENTPTMTTRNVETLISDSGIIRYRITSPLWLMYEEARQPHWRFPEGLQLERYDDFFHKNANIECDSATYFKDKGLWRLDGHVRITNTLDDKFATNQLYWNEKTHSVYSDSFIHIERTDRVLEGFGFTSNDRLTNYTIRQVSGIFPTEGLRAGATAVDTVAAAAAPPPAYPTPANPKPADPAAP